MKTWEQLAEEINTWAFRNYGNHSTPWQLMLGVVEEVGEFYEARDRNDRSAMVDSFGDQAIYALSLCKTVNIPTFPDNQYLSGWYKRVTVEDLLRAIGTGSRGILKNSQGIRGMGEVQMRDHITSFIRVWQMWTTHELELYALQPLLGHHQRRVGEGVGKGLEGPPNNRDLIASEKQMQRSSRRGNPNRCICGAEYGHFRTGQTFATVRKMMYNDPHPEHGGWRHKRRHGVSGYWREEKLRMWDSVHGYCIQYAREHDIAA